ncbi:MAG: hypothetical protein J7L54_04895 [Elusimicrobia bacterium]|nr:hypothetical protein [Elusimicrobiota bacterium]
MRKILVFALFAVVGVTVFASRAAASEISLADECGILLASTDDTSALSDGYSAEDSPQYGIFVKPNFTFALKPISENSNLITDRAALSAISASLYSKENPHFRFFIKLE